MIIDLTHFISILPMKNVGNFELYIPMQRRQWIFLKFLEKCCEQKRRISSDELLQFYQKEIYRGGKTPTLAMAHTFVKRALGTFVFKGLLKVTFNPEAIIDVRGIIE